MSRTPDRLTAAFNQLKSDFKMLINPKTYEHLTQNQIIGGLTVLLLIVGVVTGTYLGSEEQDIRQQAAYAVCVSGINGCGAGDAVGSTCTSSQGPGTCSIFNESTGLCNCISEVGAACLAKNGTCVNIIGAPSVACPSEQVQDGICSASAICCVAAPVCIPVNSACSNNAPCCDGDEFGNGVCRNGVCIDEPTTTPIPEVCAGGFCHLTGSPACEQLGTAGQYVSVQTEPGVCTADLIACCPTGPTPTPVIVNTATPIPNNCSSRNGVCVNPGNSCGSGRVASGTCTGVDVGATCCVPAPTNTPSSCTVDGQSCTNTNQCCNNGVCSGTPGNKTCQQQYCERSGPLTGQNSCTDKEPGDSCVTTSNAAGFCDPTIPDQAATECECRPICGDAVCSANLGETCSTCSQDCGICPSPTRSPTPTLVVINTAIPTNTPINPTNTPVNPTNTPVPPTNTPMGPVCMSVTVNNPGAPTVNSPFVQFQQVTLTCGTAAGASRYEFRLKVLSNNTIIEREPSATTPTVSDFFTLSTGGDYVAQCRPCGGVSDSTCAPWMN